MSQTDSVTLSQDLVFEVLKSPRRRYALYYLRQQNRPVDLSEITEQVAAWENRTTTDALETEQRKRVYISLYQTHLPKLADAGIVEYDRNRGVVELSQSARELDEYLGDRGNHAIEWDKYYLGLSIGSVLLLVTVWLNVYPLSLLTELTTTLIIIAAFAVAALVQHVHTRHRNAGDVPPELGRSKT